jgi:hypothetical protein
MILLAIIATIGLARSLSYRAAHVILRLLFKRGDERILRELLGDADIAHHPRETGDPRRSSY